MGAHRAALLTAHREVFGDTGVDEAWFDWKFRRGGGVGAALWAGSQMAAFCGGVPRTLRDRGRPVRALQIGDVMVRPAWRTAGRRAGAFHRVSRALYDNCLGPGKAHAWGFGFPSHRHLKLAVSLQLLHDAGPMTGAVWSTPGALGRQWQVERLSPGPGEADSETWADTDGFEGAIAACWRSMRSDGARWTLGDRSSDHLRWRYAARSTPTAPASFWVVRRNWHALPTGVVVIRCEGGTAMWLDWIGPPSLLPLGLAAARVAAGATGCREVHAWMSAAPWSVLGGAASGALAHHEVARIGVPVASTLSAAEAAAMPWWFMGGDTDFL